VTFPSSHLMRLTPLLAAVLGVSSLLYDLTGFHATILAGP
jgi:hypothetical protein